MAFEPAPILANFLRFNLQANRQGHLQLVEKAVAERDADAVPFYIVNGGRSFRNSLVGKQAEKINVSTTTLDTYCDSSGLVPNVIKIDVEGAELAVLRGGERVLRQYQPALILEVHSFMLPERQTEEILNLVRDCGYVIQESDVFQFDGGQLENFLCLARP